MENLRLYCCALTNGSNNLTNKLSVTALKRLLPVFLMMIFLGIGTDVLGQQKSTFTGTAIFTQNQLNIFDGDPQKTDKVSTLYSGNYITLSSSSDNVQATINTPKGAQGTKVRPSGAFTITAKEGATITSITLITDRYDRQLTSSVTAEETVDNTGTNRTYTYCKATGAISSSFPKEKPLT